MAKSLGPSVPSSAAKLGEPEAPPPEKSAEAGNAGGGAAGRAPLVTLLGGGGREAGLGAGGGLEG